ncbi:MAG: MarR family winged helix-turn-helix transcriptional regulator [Streptosporangiaceae bacterium]
MTDQSRPTQQDWDLANGCFELIGNIVGQAEGLAQRLGVPVPFVKALHTLDCPMAMKELGKRMHCDPSFVTLVADMLEKRGLARREPHPADRRVKNLVLTDDGLALKRKVEEELSSRMPWNRALNQQERARLLALIRKMLSADTSDTWADAGTSGAGGSGPDAAGASGLSDVASLLLAASLQEQSPDTTKSRPPASTGEVNSVVSETATTS